MIGAGVWAICITSADHYFRQAVETLLGDIKKHEFEVMAVIVVFASLLWLIHFYRQRQRR